jgi:hypothetical protein
MSCLYSSPEVTSLIVGRSCHFVGSATRGRAPNRRCAHADLPDIVVNKDTLPAFPAAYAAGCRRSFRLPQQAQLSRVSFQTQYQAFVHFAVKSSAAL